MIYLDPLAQVPLYEQIYDQMRSAILSGVHGPGTRLPSVRVLALDLHCSRNTVEAAYRILVQEGFVESKPGSGFTVSSTRGGFLLDENAGHPGSARNRQRSHPGAAPTQAAAAPDSERSDSTPESDLVPARYDFTYGNLERGTFPVKQWKRIAGEVLDSDDLGHMESYNTNHGEWELRQIIAAQQAQFRGVRCTAEQVIVQSGTQPSLRNLLLLFDAATHTFAMEEPGYSGVRTAVSASGFRICALPVYPYDEDRYFSVLEEQRPKLVYITPSNQFPTGQVMSRRIRDRLCAWAEETDAYIVEDDYCFEYNCKNNPLPAVQALDPFNRVVYMGTLSKSLSPDLRVNFLILPPPLLKRWHECFCYAYPAISWVVQRVIAEYLKSNHRAHQLRKLQMRIADKHRIILNSLREHMAGKVEILDSGAGMHTLVNVLDGRSQGELIALAREQGVRVYGTDEYWMADEHPLKSCVLVGFSAIPLEDIEDGIATLARAWFGEAAD